MTALVACKRGKRLAPGAFAHKGGRAVVGEADKRAGLNYARFLEVL
jgi:hypothetical protein